jgi:NAD(P)-dependent dehydrogenase (short-subunit alcohol dehydrogenase family)
VDDFTRPVVTATRTSFLTARAAARHMIPRGRGVILAFGGEGDPLRDHDIGGLQVAFHAIEAMRRQLATGLGRHGIRVVILRTGGVPESISADVPGRDRIEESIAASTLLGGPATLEDVGDAAAWAASDRARTMTAATINVSSGALLD